MMMARFRTELDTRDLNREVPEGKIRLMLLAPLIYDSALLNRTLIVPAKFVTDLASVPRVFWVIIPPMGRYNGPAVLHDWLYQQGDVNRGQADGVFREAMAVSGVRASLRCTIWIGVRGGGWLMWRRYRRMERVEVDAKRAA